MDCRIHRGNVKTQPVKWAFSFRRRELAPHGITLRQSQVLGWLALKRELTQAQLCELMRLEPPTLVRILDRMERDGWIRRHADTSDRRKKLIRPTPQVRPVWEQIRGCILRVRARATEGITAKNLQLAREVLTAMHKNLLTPALVGEFAS
ncbi:MAG: MarR family transcriptional regulator [Gemmataceae bacterium]|nr:MarR family transcriptional regulator [Gemmataceae bacterium]